MSTTYQFVTFPCAVAVHGSSIQLWFCTSKTSIKVYH